MKSRFLTLVIFIISISFMGCDKCNELICSSPPMFINLELLDDETKENLFANGTYDSNLIAVTNIDDGVKCAI